LKAPNYFDNLNNFIDDIIITYDSRTNNVKEIKKQLLSFKDEEKIALALTGLDANKIIEAAKYDMENILESLKRNSANFEVCIKSATKLLENHKYEELLNIIDEMRELDLLITAKISNK